MPWYVSLIQTGGPAGPLKAIVEYFSDDAAYQRATNSTPAPAGGYPTQAAATAVADKYNKQPAAQKNLATPANIPTGKTAGVGFTVPNPLAGVAGSLEAFYDVITDGKMWRSLGWLLLGIVLMLIGVLLWIGPSAARRSPIGIAGSVAGQLG